MVLHVASLLPSNCAALDGGKPAVECIGMVEERGERDVGSDQHSVERGDVVLKEIADIHPAV